MIIIVTVVAPRNALCHDLLHPPHGSQITEPSIPKVPLSMNLKPPPSFYAFINNLQLPCRSPHDSHARIKHLAAIYIYPNYAILQTTICPVNFFRTFSKLTYRRGRLLSVT